MASKRICAASSRVFRASAVASPARPVTSRSTLLCSLYSRQQQQQQQHTSPPSILSLWQPQQQKHAFSTSRSLPEQNQQQTSSSSPPPSKIYTFDDIKSLISSPSPCSSIILVDVREPAELAATGTIPTSVNVPVASAPDAFFLPAKEFETKYGFERPGYDKEVVFFCKAGVRSNAAARLAAQAGFGGKVGEFPGSWNEWTERGGPVERV